MSTSPARDGAVSTSPARDGTERAQREAIESLRGAAPSASARLAASDTPYAGLVTRALALALDGAIVEGTAASVAVTAGLALSLLHLPSETDKVLVAVGGFVWVLWSLGYFVFFWSSTGQTPGSRVMSIAVVDVKGRGPLKPRRALVRFACLCIGAAALLTGILIMLWDGRRRCFHDRTARTLVVYVPQSPG